MKKFIKWHDSQSIWVLEVPLPAHCRKGACYALSCFFLRDSWILLNDMSSQSTWFCWVILCHGFAGLWLLDFLLTGVGATVDDLVCFWLFWGWLWRSMPLVPTHWDLWTQLRISAGPYVRENNCFFFFERLVKFNKWHEQSVYVVLLSYIFCRGFAGLCDFC